MVYSLVAIFFVTELCLAIMFARVSANNMWQKRPKNGSPLTYGVPRLSLETVIAFGVRVVLLWLSQIY